MIETETVHNSKPPLRWFANWAGNRASSALMRISWAQEEDRDSGVRYKIDTIIWDILWPVYHKYGTFYKVIRFDFTEEIDKEEYE